jgi:hypothetical protein
MVERVSRTAGVALGWLLCLAVGARLAPWSLRQAREAVSEAVRAVRSRLSGLLRLRRRRRPAPAREVELTGRGGAGWRRLVPGLRPGAGRSPSGPARGGC